MFSYKAVLPEEAWQYEDWSILEMVNLTSDTYTLYSVYEANDLAYKDTKALVLMFKPRVDADPVVCAFEVAKDKRMCHYGENIVKDILEAFSGVKFVYHSGNVKIDNLFSLFVPEDRLIDGKTSSPAF